MAPSRSEFDTQFDRTGWGSRSSSNRSLVDICSDAFLLIFHIDTGNDPGHIDTLRKDVARLLDEIERHGKHGGHAAEDIKATRYAICALVDETILNSQWSFKDQWADRPLQLEYFGEHMAGERFFDLLEKIRQKGARKVDLLEVFCICLLLGFQGQYKLRSEELSRLIKDIIREIHHHRGSPVLAPHAGIPDEVVREKPSTIPRWMWISAGISALIVLIVFIIFKLWLGSAAAEATRRMIL